MRGQPYGTKVDVHSFGVVLLEAACVGIGMPSTAVRQQFMNAGGRGAILRGWRPKCSSDLIELRPKLAQLVNDCLEREPNDRPDFLQVVSRIEEVGSAQVERRH